jgi:hypothetical protein
MTDKRLWDVCCEKARAYLGLPRGEPGFLRPSESEALYQETVRLYTFHENRRSAKREEAERKKQKHYRRDKAIYEQYYWGEPVAAMCRRFKLSRWHIRRIFIEQLAAETITAMFVGTPKDKAVEAYYAKLKAKK